MYFKINLFQIIYTNLIAHTWRPNAKALANTQMHTSRTSSKYSVRDDESQPSYKASPVTTPLTSVSRKRTTISSLMPFKRLKATTITQTTEQHTQSLSPKQQSSTIPVKNISSLWSANTLCAAEDSIEKNRDIKTWLQQVSDTGKGIVG